MPARSQASTRLRWLRPGTFRAACDARPGTAPPAGRDRPGGPARGVAVRSAVPSPRVTPPAKPVAVAKPGPGPEPAPPAPAPGPAPVAAPAPAPQEPRL